MVGPSPHEQKEALGGDPRAMDTTTRIGALMSEAQSTEPLDAEQQTRIAGYVAMAGNSQIERTELGDVTVDTSWVSYADPRIETMILGGEYDHHTVATPYVDEADAQAGHAAVVEALRDGRTPDGLVA